MVLLIHHPASAFGRKVRLQMSEKKMLYILREEEPWRLSEDVFKLNPAGELPIFLNDGQMVIGHYAISEYLEETSTEIPLIFGDALQKAEIRQVGGFLRGAHRYSQFLLRQIPPGCPDHTGRSNCLPHLLRGLSAGHHPGGHFPVPGEADAPAMDWPGNYSPGAGFTEPVNAFLFSRNVLQSYP